MPPPTFSSHFASDAFGSLGASPVRTSADSASDDQRVGSPRSARSAIVRISRVCPASVLVMRITGSSSSFATTWIGSCPRSVTATFTTLPPTSLQIGGVSLQPPARSTRTGVEVQTA